MSSPMDLTVPSVSENQTTHSNVTGRSSSSSGGPMCSSGENTVVRVHDSNSKTSEEMDNVTNSLGSSSQPNATNITTTESTNSDVGSDLSKMLIFQLLNELYTKKNFYQQALAESRKEDYSHLSKLFEERDRTTTTNDNVCVSEIVAKTVESMNDASISKLPEANHLLKKLDRLLEAKKQIVEIKKSAFDKFDRKRIL